MEYLKKAGAGFWAANVIQAFFFGFAHLNLVQGTYAFFLGLTCGYVVLRYRSLLAGIAVHMVFNAYGTFVTPLLNMIFGSEPSAAVEIGYYVAAIVFGCSDDNHGVDVEQIWQEERETIWKYLDEHADGEVTKYAYTFGDLTDTIYIFGVEGGSGEAGAAPWALVDYDLYTTRAIPPIAPERA